MEITSKYLESTEPLEFSYKNGQDFDYTKIKELIQAIDEEVRELFKDVWEEGYKDKENEPSETMIERGLRDKAKNPYK